MRVSKMECDQSALDLDSFTHTPATPSFRSFPYHLSYPADALDVALQLIRVVTAAAGDDLA